MYSHKGSPEVSVQNIEYQSERTQKINSIGAPAESSNRCHGTHCTPVCKFLYHIVTQSIYTYMYHVQVINFPLAPRKSGRAVFLANITKSPVAALLFVFPPSHQWLNGRKDVFIPHVCETETQGSRSALVLVKEKTTYKNT